MKLALWCLSPELNETLDFIGIIFSTKVCWKHCNCMVSFPHKLSYHKNVHSKENFQQKRGYNYYLWKLCFLHDLSHHKYCVSRHYFIKVWLQISHSKWFLMTSHITNMLMKNIAFSESLVANITFKWFLSFMTFLSTNMLIQLTIFNKSFAANIAFKRFLYSMKWFCVRFKKKAFVFCWKRFWLP